MDVPVSGSRGPFSRRYAEMTPPRSDSAASYSPW